MNNNPTGINQFSGGGKKAINGKWLNKRNAQIKTITRVSAKVAAAIRGASAKFASSRKRGTL